MFWTLVHGFFLHLSRTYNIVQVIDWRVKLYRNELKGNKNNFEFAGGSSYQGFELPRVKYYSTWKKEILGKSTLVWVSARFELVRVRVIGSQMYYFYYWCLFLSRTYQEQFFYLCRIVMGDQVLESMCYSLFHLTCPKNPQTDKAPFDLKK